LTIALRRLVFNSSRIGQQTRFHSGERQLIYSWIGRAKTLAADASSFNRASHPCHVHQFAVDMATCCIG
jgi:hypothetical protein